MLPEHMTWHTATHCSTLQHAATTQLRLVAYFASSSSSTLQHTATTQTGGMFPELITRSDIDVFLPPIGGQVDLFSFFFGQHISRLVEIHKSLFVIKFTM